jgi:hypothetical protein
MFYGPPWRQGFSHMYCKILCISVAYVHTRIGGQWQDKKLRLLEVWYNVKAFMNFLQKIIFLWLQIAMMTVLVMIILVHPHVNKEEGILTVQTQLYL